MSEQHSIELDQLELFREMKDMEGKARERKHVPPFGTAVAAAPEAVGAGLHVSLFATSKYEGAASSGRPVPFGRWSGRLATR